MSDYPVSYEHAESIDGDVGDWLQNYSTEELAEKLENFHSYQLEWFSVNTDNPEKKAVIEAEIESREDYTRSMEDEDNDTANGSRKGVWDSGLEILEDFEDLAQHLIGAKSLEQYAKNELGIEKNKVVLPEEVRKTCIAIQEEVNEEYGSGCEFGVLFKGEWTDDGFQVKPDYVIPEQKVSKAHITYTEDLKKYRDEGYIVNIHSHPWAGESSGFSGTDNDHINSHFDMAVLYAGGAETFADAVAQVEVENGVTARISPEVVVEKPERELPEIEGMENVETKKKKSNNSNTRGESYSRRSYTRYKNAGNQAQQTAFTELDYY